MTGELKQVEAMRMGVDYSFPVTFPPPRTFSVILRPLSNSEMMKSYSAVGEQLARMPKFAQTKLQEDNFLAREFLKTSSSPFGEYRPSITDPMLDEMTTDEIMFLYNEWLAIVSKVNPNLEQMPKERLDELVAAVKKNPTLASTLTELSFWQLRDIVRYLLTSDV